MGKWADLHHKEQSLLEEERLSKEIKQVRQVKGL